MTIPDRAVFDTNILIDYTYDRPGAARTIEQCADRVISQMSWIEFLAGFRDNGEQQRARAFLKDNFEIVPMDEDICDLVIGFRQQRRFKLPDAVIYATAAHLNIALITRNTKDFDKSWPDVYVPYEV